LKIYSIGKPQSYRYGISRIIVHAQVNQEELLVARNKKQHQEVYVRIHKMPIEQSIIYEESQRTIPIRNTRRTMARDQY